VFGRYLVVSKNPGTTAEAGSQVELEALLDSPQDQANGGGDAQRWGHGNKRRTCSSKGTPISMGIKTGRLANHCVETRGMLSVFSSRRPLIQGEFTRQPPPPPFL